MSHADAEVADGDLVVRGQMGLPTDGTVALDRLIESAITPGHGEAAHLCGVPDRSTGTGEPAPVV